MAKTLIAYYSRRGENYVNGSIKDLKLGNTEVVAAKIKALLPDADMFRIDTTYEYSKSYMTCTLSAIAIHLITLLLKTAITQVRLKMQ